MLRTIFKLYIRISLILLSSPNHGRISGIVEESPGRLEYVVALYRETTTKSGDFVMPVNEAVPIGTRLQLRATINTQSGMEKNFLSFFYFLFDCYETYNNFAVVFVNTIRRVCFEQTDFSKS